MQRFDGTLKLPNNTDFLTINDNAFNGCTGFTGSLTIPNKVRSIGQYAFADCSGFDGTLTLPDNYNNYFSELSEGVFKGCSGFTGTLVIPNLISTIGDFAFQTCSGFTGLTLNNNLSTIGAQAFSECSGISGSITFPYSMMEIKEKSFENCVDLNFVYFSSSQMSIRFGNNVFDGCIGEFVAISKMQYEQFKNVGAFSGLNLTYQTSVTFYALGGTFTEGGTVTVIQSKLFGKQMNYIKDGETSIWAIDPNYTLPKATKAGCVFDSYNTKADGTGTKLELTTLINADSANAFAQYIPLELSSIDVKTEPTKKVYAAFEDFDSTGMVITANFSHGDEIITNYKIEGGTNFQAGTTSITVSYTEGNVTKKATVTITVNKIELDMGGISFTGKTVKENGVAHTLVILGDLPNGVIVSYSGTNGYAVSGVSAAGEYVVTATFTIADSDNYNVPKARMATLYINVAEIMGGTENGENMVIIGGESGVKPGSSVIVTEIPADNYKDSNFTVGNEKQTVMQANDIKLMLGGVAAQPDGSVTVKLLIKDFLRGYNGLMVMYIAPDGTATDMNAVREGDYMVFDTTHFSVYAIVAPTSVVAPINDDGLSGWIIAVIVLASILLIIILLMLAMFLFRKNKEVGFKEYYVSLGSKFKGVFVKNKNAAYVPQDNPESAQDSIADGVEAIEVVGETYDSKLQESTAKSAKIVAGHSEPDEADEETGTAVMDSTKANKNEMTEET